MQVGRLVILWAGGREHDNVGLVTQIDHDNQIATVLSRGKLERWNVAKLLLMNYREL